MIDLKDKDNYDYEAHVLDVAHRLTGYDIDVIEEYCRVKKVKELGKMRLSDFEKVKAREELFFIQRRLKLKKLINKIR